MTYIMVIITVSVTPSCALLPADFFGGSSTADSWWLEEGAEPDVSIDEMLDALEVILRTNDATMKAHAADETRTIHKVFADHNITAPSTPDIQPPELVRARRWIRETLGREDFDYLTKRGLLGEIGQDLPPEDLVKHTNAQNVLFTHSGQTAPAVGFAHIKLDLSSVDLVRFVDMYSNAIRQAARIFKICSVQGMFRNNSAAGEFRCEPHNLDPASLMAHMSLAEHFHSYVSFRAQVQALRDSFRPLKVLNDDFEANKGPTTRWMDDLKLSFRQLVGAAAKSRPERAISLAVLGLSMAGSALINFLWSYFSPSESVNTAHIATVAAQTVAHGESLEATFSILTETTVAVDALNDAVARNARLEEYVTRLNFARDAINRRISMVQSVLDSAASGKLSSVAFSLFDLRATANEIRNRARAMHMKPIAGSFIELLQTDVSLFTEPYGFSVVLHVPLIKINDDGEMQMLDIYQLADLPISLSPSLQLSVAPAAKKLLAISPSRQWRTMTAADLFSCSKLGTFYLCPLTGVLRNPLPDTRTESIDDDACIYHLYVGNFKGAASACDSSVREKELGVTQTGPFTFAAFAPPSKPVLGEAVCPADPTFRRTLLISNLTTFSLPPSCEMSLGSYYLHSADRSFIRKGTGTSFSYPFPSDLIGGDISEPELEAVKSSLTVARTLAKETRLEAWKRTRQMRSIMTDVSLESHLSLMLSGALYAVVFIFAAGITWILHRFHRRISRLEGTDTRCDDRPPRPPPRSPFYRMALKRRRTEPLFSHATTDEETSLTQPINLSQPRSMSDPGLPPASPPAPPVYPVLPTAAPARNTSAPASISVHNGAAVADVPKPSSPLPPPYLVIGTKKP